MKRTIIIITMLVVALIATMPVQAESEIPNVCPSEYAWGDPAPGYTFADWPLFKSWMYVEFTNVDGETIYNVQATIEYTPANVTATDPGPLYFGTLNSGGSQWSGGMFRLTTDMANPSDPNESVLWTVEYDDSESNHHVITGVPQHCN